MSVAMHFISLAICSLRISCCLRGRKSEGKERERSEGSRGYVRRVGIITTCRSLTGYIRWLTM